ncbi:hypothetical protein M758_1G308700 [Ceratodon purpureus]|uniref:Uncharacterized protein n=1 Tax=Ceratodon purpureus TaxID=3225 RepID=A0A8T0JE22_CERPU|nr:hypothetical protein KC19_1G316000 [Ceratodon purpureus]KAG0632155.1 hypothetical protein M758_1G308700 [Ceratodon purpureus]
MLRNCHLIFDVLSNFGVLAWLLLTVCTSPLSSDEQASESSYCLRLRKCPWHT